MTKVVPDLRLTEAMLERDFKRIPDGLIIDQVGARCFPNRAMFSEFHNCLAILTYQSEVDYSLNEASVDLSRYAQSRDPRLQVKILQMARDGRTINNQYALATIEAAIKGHEKNIGTNDSFYWWITEEGIVKDIPTAKKSTVYDTLPF